MFILIFLLLSELQYIILYNRLYLLAKFDKVVMFEHCQKVVSKLKSLPVLPSFHHRLLP